MSDFRKLSDDMLASPQLTADDIEAARAEGVTLIINNRPDGEDSAQPQGAEIEAAARAAGMDYVAIPVTSAGFSQPQVAAMAEALEQAKGKVLAYCRSGTRSTFLWSLASASAGKDPRDIAACALGAGYDISPIMPTLEALAAQSRG
ncbi:TIGR01244 family sulfur transferase [Qipengyuania vesicularis]|uniref:TIGR01244 family sulfur transferase n=1 Tax=Qipengyuania vesicularis TaxID=2867232 RepID=UPI0031F13A2B